VPNEPAVMRKVRLIDDKANWRVSSARDTLPYDDKERAAHTKCGIEMKFTGAIEYPSRFDRTRRYERAWYCSLKRNTGGVYPPANNYDEERAVRTKCGLVGRVGVEPTAR
jgi:hypothetical protein